MFVGNHLVNCCNLQLIPFFKKKKFSNLLGNINESHEDELENETSNLIDLLIAGDTSGNLHLRFRSCYSLNFILLCE